MLCVLHAGHPLRCWTAVCRAAGAPFAAHLPGGRHHLSGSVVTVGHATRGDCMGRARRARKIAATAAYGGGGLAAGIGALGALGYGVLKVEAQIARRIVGSPSTARPTTTAPTAPASASPSSSSSSATPPPPAWAPTTATRPSARSSPTASPPSPVGRCASPTPPSSAPSPPGWSSSSPTRSTRCPGPTSPSSWSAPTTSPTASNQAVAVRHLETAVRGCASWAPRSSSAPVPTSAPSSRSPSRCG